MGQPSDPTPSASNVKIPSSTSAMASLPSNLSLANKVAIVTGASRGIGAGIAVELARRGAKLALVYRSDTSTPLAEKVAAQIKELGSTATLIQTDLNDVDCGKTIIQKTLQGLSVHEIHILINNAAVDPPLHKTIDFDTAFFEEMMNTNVRAPLLLVQALIPHLPSHSGRIINISSTLARFPGADLALYSSSKAALECLTRHWALELAKPHNLTVNNVALGWIDTESTALIPEADREPLLELPSAARRFGKVGEIADIVGFLASEGASWMNGDTVGASGGTVYM